MRSTGLGWNLYGESSDRAWLHSRLNFLYPGYVDNALQHCGTAAFRIPTSPRHGNVWPTLRILALEVHVSSLERKTITPIAWNGNPWHKGGHFSNQI